jgi:hypothetical protein
MDDGGRPTCIVLVDQHALEWSTNMHWNGRPTCIGTVDRHALEWSTDMQRSSLVVFISKEQTKETDDGVDSLFLSGLQNSVGGNEVRTLFVIAELLSETQVPLGTECREKILRIPYGIPSGMSSR